MNEVSEKLCLWLKDELSLFPFLDGDDLEEIPCYFELMVAPEGKVVCEEGQMCDFVAFITDGKLEIRKETEFKGKQVVIGVYSKGSVMGELCILDNHPRAITAVALEDTTLVILSRENFNKLMEEYPEIAMKFMKGLLLAVSIRLRKSYDRLASIF
jgi:CRP-like cAMP-binding protein